jgi:hypothetical protein
VRRLEGRLEKRELRRLPPALVTKRQPEALAMLLRERTSPEIERLPPNYKWEFLRRHPLYLRYWKMANLYLTIPPNHPARLWPEWKQIETSYRIISQLVGGPEFRCPDPSKPSAELADGFLLTQHGVENARMATFREIAEILLLLPESTRKAVSAILGADAKGGQEGDLFSQRESLMRLTDDALQKTPPRLRSP